MQHFVCGVNDTKVSRRSRFNSTRRFSRTGFVCIAICIVLSQLFFVDVTISPDQSWVINPIVGKIRLHRPSTLDQWNWTRNTTSSFFELARTFDKSGEAEIAIAIYGKLLDRIIPEDTELPHMHRTALLYFCHYRISRCCLQLNEPEEAISHANAAFQRLPRREPYYHVAKFFDEQIHNESMAMQYYRLAAGIPTPPTDAPFREAEVYAVDIEREILWPRVFPREYLQSLSDHQHILDSADTDDEIHAQTHNELILNSRSLFAEGFEELFRKEGPFRPNETDNDFYYSTPTIVRIDPDRADDFLIVCRLINYRIDPVNRWYRDFLPPGGEPHSLKSGMALHRGIHDEEGILITISDDSFKVFTSDAVGPEDPKMLRLRRHGSPYGNIELIMTSWEYSGIAGTGARMASGTLHPERGLLEVKHAFPSPHNRSFEKNWVMFQPPGHQKATVYFVYEWHPLTIGTVVDEANHVIDFHLIINTPRSFMFLRGSTNGVAYGQEIWFMVHGVGRLDYIYYHKIVVLDAETLHVRKHSYPFRLEGFHTEFCLGLDIDGGNETMTIAYSVLDGASVLRRIALWKLEALMVT